VSDSALKYGPRGILSNQMVEKYSMNIYVKFLIR